MARRRINEHRAIVTGASSGIGWHLALELARRRCRLVLCGRRAQRLEDLTGEVARLGGQAIAVAGDLADPLIRVRAVSTAEHSFGGLDFLINNAGVGAIGRFADADPDRLRDVMEVNFFAAAELVRLAVPILARGNHPMIVNVSSVLGHRAMPLKSEYCASKFALHGWSDALRGELARDGIDVLLVSPSTTDSEFFQNVLENTAGRDLRMSRAASPEWVARRTIRAMEQGRHEIILSTSGRLMVWLDRLCPPLANRLAARWGQ
jgi:short-subunit dehydrogenase